MDADLDEETQLALALSISEVETSGRPVYPSAAAPNNHLKPPHKKTDAELARELQQKFDQEAAAAVPPLLPPSQLHPPPLLPPPHPFQVK